MTRRPAKRLIRDDWLAAGERLLATQGPEALKAEPMARHMATTKGSFYWHFRDVADFHAQLLARWRSAATAALDAAKDTAGTPAARLRALAEALADPDPDRATEAAIRTWAGAHTGARETLAGVDRARRAALLGLLADNGISNPEMARIVHAAALGMALDGEIGAGARRAAIGSLVDLVLALR